MCQGRAACAQCTKNCAIVHRKKDVHSSGVTRFFKLMHGKTYTDILYLPPKFARTVTHLVGQEAKIEDADGETFFVTFSKVNDSLAFKEGWPAFYRAHHLEFGDVLVFNYMKKGHFIVQIYDASACERIEFSTRRSLKKKRPRINPEILFEDESLQAVDVDPIEKPSSSVQFVSASKVSKCESQSIRKNLSGSHGNLQKVQVQPIYINLEDPICMLNRDDSYPKEDRSFLHDLSNFEMKKTTSGACSFEKSSNDTERINCPPDGYLTDEPHCKPSEIGKSSISMPEGVDKTLICDTGFIEDGNRILASGGEVPSLGFSRVADQENGSMPNFFGFNDSSAKQPNTIKKELLGSYTGFSDISSSEVPMQENAFIPNSLALPTLGLKPRNELVLSRDQIKPSEKHSAVLEELVESRENTKTSVAESLPITEKKTTVKQASAIKKELVESGEEVRGLSQISKGTGHHSIWRRQVSKRGNVFTPKSVGSDLLDKNSAAKTSTAESLQISNMMADTLPLKQAAAVKKELVEFGKDVHLSQASKGKPFGQTCSMVVKVEPGLSDDTARPSVAGSFCAEVKSNSYLVLPVCFPAPPRKRKNGLGRVVYLKDASGRSWPVVYHDMCYMRAFTDHWRSFCEANQVECGDVCEFNPETQKSLICYRVLVLKSG